MDQDKIFINSEGDRWFERNKEALKDFRAGADLALRLVDFYGLRPRQVVEIGAANGYRLATIRQRYGSRVVAVEPSLQALLDGTRRYPRVEFVRGEAAHVPLQSCFDLIIFDFVLHWIDRKSLLKVLAEADRLLVDGGYMIIGDFQPVNFLRVPYHHLADSPVRTFKQNYADTFLASGLYHPVGLLTGDHSLNTVTGLAGERERVGAWLIRKQLLDHYLQVGL
ncbi:MAG: class I SAM-dependent methyltransferase [Deltaproteobacteria bacterium]|nr:class I SAM-dependent methyltransferase [Deltaproteobacteria bacterium]